MLVGQRSLWGKNNEVEFTKGGGAATTAIAQKDAHGVIGPEGPFLLLSLTGDLFPCCAPCSSACHRKFIFILIILYLLPPSTMINRPIKTAVLGVGLAGLSAHLRSSFRTVARAYTIFLSAFHVPFVLALPELFVLSAVLERNPQSAGGKVNERFGVTVPKIYKTLDDVLADPEIELVIVGTPNDTHYKFAKAVLSAGKHGIPIRFNRSWPGVDLKTLAVLVDKPVTATSEQAKELGALAKSKNLVVYAYQNRRWDSDFLTLRKLLSLPESSPQSLGAIHEFESRYVSGNSSGQAPLTPFVGLTVTGMLLKDRGKTSLCPQRGRLMILGPISSTKLWWCVIS